VLVPFPFTDLVLRQAAPSAGRVRDGWNAAQRMLCSCAHLAADRPARAADLVLTAADLQAGGLPNPSLVRATKIFTMHQGLLRRTLGHLPRISHGGCALAELRNFFA